MYYLFIIYLFVYLFICLFIYLLHAWSENRSSNIYVNILQETDMRYV